MAGDDQGGNATVGGTQTATGKIDVTYPINVNTRLCALVLSTGSNDMTATLDYSYPGSPKVGFRISLRNGGTLFDGLNVFYAIIAK